MLARLVRAWGWKEQAGEAWWSVANRRTGQRPALAELFEMASQDKDTRELYRVSRRILEIEPGSPVAKNNVAMFALLRREDLPEAHKLAAEDFAVAPSEPAIVSTYAFSLYLQGRTQDAVTLMAKLPAAAFDDPSMAACNGVLLSAAGEVEKARPFLDLAMREKARLFPEEIALAEQALRQP
jgi:Flp pilus assembly protein TadD